MLTTPADMDITPELIPHELLVNPYNSVDLLSSVNRDFEGNPGRQSISACRIRFRPMQETGLNDSSSWEQPSW